MDTYAAYTRSSTVVHLAQPTRKWYSGMTGTTLCGARAQRITNTTKASAAGYAQPFGTCKRCAATLGQTVREPRA